MHGLKFLGRPPIKLAESVKDVVNLENEYASLIMNRSSDLNPELMEAITGQSLFSWGGRNPRPALDKKGDFQGTDLDLFSFLVPLKVRGAVVEIPKYRNRRKIVVKAHDRKIGTNQFGKITGLISNKDVLSFSTRLWDNTIVTQDPESGIEITGKHRNYMIVDCDGHWYDGWNKIVFSPIAKENDFIFKKGLLTGNIIYFTNYVHPNRWQSVFGAPYLLLKMLLARIDDEAGFYRREFSLLKNMGFNLPPGQQEQYEPPIYEGETTPIKVKTIEMEIDLPSFKEAYDPTPNNQVGLVQAYQRQKFLTWTLKPAIHFIARSDEAAYFNYGQGRIANWMEGRSWNKWRKPKGKVDWNQMVLSNDCALRYRIKTVTEQVSTE